ncbi:MAG: TonB-dependent receptor, partial [Alphaproteobacteria bacterium]|nr:TonB-dependent receptor [Alphaproteobacteria bacterium]
FNRGAGQGNPENGFIPASYGTDTIRNFEIGWKTRMLGGNLQLNGAAFFVQWKDMQVPVFDQDIFFLTFIDNAADAELWGIEGDITWLATENLQISAAFSFLDTKLTDTPPGIISLAPEGSELALAPPFQGNLRAKYYFMVGNGWEAHVQGGIRYAARSFSSIVAEERFRQDDYFLIDGSIGIQKDRWKAEIFFENLTDERPDLFINTQDNTRRTTTSRPRTIGLRVSFDY